MTPNNITHLNEEVTQLVSEGMHINEAVYVVSEEAAEESGIEAGDIRNGISELRA